MTATYTAVELAELSKHAIDPELAWVVGLRGLRNGADSRGFVLPWPDVSGKKHNIPRVHKHLRTPEESDSGKGRWPAGVSPGLLPIRAGSDGGNPSTSTIIVEGFMKGMALASWAPEEHNVLTMNGCDGITDRTDLAWVRGHYVYVCFDADFRTNPKVAEATKRVAKHLTNAGAARVMLLDIKGSGKQGVDDILAEKQHPRERRRWLVERLGVPVDPFNLTATSTGKRELKLTWASEIGQRATRWLWEEPAPVDPAGFMNAGDRTGKLIALGALWLLGGREGIGKTTWAYRIAAQVTNGTLPGSLLGQPRAVVVVATEESWEQMIVPRLVAAGANLDRVARVEAVEDEYATGLTLPADVHELERRCIEHKVALVLLDPLMGTISGALDTHKDAEVRRALEPLSRLAHDAQLTILGLIHANKSASGDLLNRIMASKAFTATARGVLYASVELPEPGVPPVSFESYWLGQIKNNLAARLPWTLRYHMEGAKTGRDDELGVDIWSSRIVLDGKANQRIDELITAQESRGVERETPADRAEKWLKGYLTGRGVVPSADVKAAAKEAGHKIRTIERVKIEVGVAVTYPFGDTRTAWSLERETGGNGVDDADGGNGGEGADTQSGAKEGSNSPPPPAPVPPRASADPQNGQTFQYPQMPQYPRCECGADLLHPGSIKIGKCERCRLQSHEEVSGS